MFSVALRVQASKTPVINWNFTIGSIEVRRADAGNLAWAQVNTLTSILAHVHVSASIYLADICHVHCADSWWCKRLLGGHRGVRVSDWQLSYGRLGKSDWLFCDDDKTRFTSQTCPLGWTALKEINCYRC